MTPLRSIQLILINVWLQHTVGDDESGHLRLTFSADHGLGIPRLPPTPLDKVFQIFLGRCFGLLWTPLAKKGMGVRFVEEWLYSNLVYVDDCWCIHISIYWCQKDVGVLVSAEIASSHIVARKLFHKGHNNKILPASVTSRWDDLCAFAQGFWVTVNQKIMPFLVQWMDHDKTKFEVVSRQRHLQG